MTKVVFLPANTTVDSVEVGTRLVDVTDEHPEAEVPFSCRSASCGTCRVKVITGAEGLADPDDDELEVLEVFGDQEGVRLCCQIKLEKPVDVLTLQVVDPD